MGDSHVDAEGGRVLDEVLAVAAVETQTLRMPGWESDLVEHPQGSVPPVNVPVLGTGR